MSILSICVSVCMSISSVFLFYLSISSVYLFCPSISSVCVSFLDEFSVNLWIWFVRVYVQSVLSVYLFCLPRVLFPLALEDSSYTNHKKRVAGIQNIHNIREIKKVMRHKMQNKSAAGPRYP